MKEGKTDGSFVEQLLDDYTSADLVDVDRAILDYSVKLTQRPGEVVSEDVERLRTVGLDDRAIHDLACIVGYFAFVNRVADGLGVELES